MTHSCPAPARPTHVPNSGRPVSGGTIAVTGPDGGTRELIQEAGSPYLGRAGTEHDVVNAGGAAAVFAETS